MTRRWLIGLLLAGTSAGLVVTVRRRSAARAALGPGPRGALGTGSVAVPPPAIPLAAVPVAATPPATPLAATPLAATPPDAVAPSAAPVSHAPVSDAPVPDAPVSDAPVSAAPVAPEAGAAPDQEPEAEPVRSGESLRQARSRLAAAVGDDPAPTTNPTAGELRASLQARSPSGRAPWVEPEADGSCPGTHPVKVKLRSGLYHLPGMLAYGRTHPDRCYASEDDARADGFSRAKR